MATATPSISDSMKCPICLDFAQDAVETICCAQVYCEKCVQDLKGKNCSSCREPKLDTCVSRSVRRLLGELPVECPNSCGETTTRATMDKHKELCPKREHKCPVNDCDFSGLFQHLADHASAKHPKNVIDSLTKAFETVQIEKTQKKVFNCPFRDCQNRGEMSEQDLMDHLKSYHVDEMDDLVIEAKAFRCPFAGCNVFRLNKYDRMSRPALKDHIIQHHAQDCTTGILHPQVGPIKLFNSEERSTSMAPNGKFYCGHYAGADTKGDDGGCVKQMPCNYQSKLNCRSCMKLDVTLRNLPYGSLVNGAGHVTKPTPCTHHVEGAGYFAENFGKSALCRYTTCGNVPKFTCSMPNTDRPQNPPCTPDSPCQDCAAMNYVYGVHFPRENGVKEDKDYYSYVWKKT